MQEAGRDSSPGGRGWDDGALEAIVTFMNPVPNGYGGTALHIGFRAGSLLFYAILALTDRFWGVTTGTRVRVVGRFASDEPGGPFIVTDLRRQVAPASSCLERAPQRVTPRES